MILVTGGTGFIGSHTVVELINGGYDVVIADNLINSKKNVLNKIKKITGIKPLFYEVDVTDYKKTRKIFKEHKIEAIIHFAGLKAVGESVEKPLEYYKNNIDSTLVLIELSKEFGVLNFIFSSSATVYGDQKSPFVETMPLGETTNPYGETKKINERILVDCAKATTGLNVTLLRYFNPIGAHKSGLLGESPSGIPNNLLPYITKVAKKELEKLSVYGDDYETLDGTGVRDYIHVVDVAKGHVKALEKVVDKINVYNLGSGKGTSVLELINTFIKVNKIDIPYQITNRRSGDIDISYSDATKAKDVLGWQTELSIKDMVKDAWKFEKKAK